MASFFTYELAPQPPSLFEDGLMRKPPKSSLGLLLKSFTEQSNLPENCLFVVDGGYLLRHAIWPHPSTYAGICQNYISLMLKHYGAHSTVVFDGYGSAMQSKRNRDGELKIDRPVTSYSRNICQLPQPNLRFLPIVTIRRG